MPSATRATSIWFSSIFASRRERSAMVSNGLPSTAALMSLKKRSPSAAVLLRELDQGHELVKESMYNKSKGFGDTMSNVARTSWKMDVLYDPPVRDASMEGEFAQNH